MLKPYKILSCTKHVFYMNLDSGSTSVKLDEAAFIAAELDQNELEKSNDSEHPSS